MKVKTRTLTGFLKKARLDGKQKIDEAIFRFEKDGLKINTNSLVQQARVMAWLKREAFEGYQELGNIGLNDLSNVSRVLERFGETIEISKEGNLLTIKETGKKVDIELVSEAFLSTDTGEPNLVFDETLTLTATQLKNIYKDVSINEDALIDIETQEKKVAFKNTGKYKFFTELSAPTCKGGVKVKFGQPLIDSTINLDGNLEISLKSDHPAKIRESTDTSVITLIVAPRVDEE